MLKKKTSHMEEWERHGCLLVDECKVSKTKKFDKNLMDFIRFIDLGSHTPQKMENKLGDHALVIMFQPFAGHGLQALACFISGGDVTGDVLTKIMLECVILCENAGLFIYVITSDGASWNRKMWKHFEIEDTSEPWCEHPMDNKRKLRMCSDFPHLIKCLRNNLITKKKFKVY
ncbi:uncharacterized protein LOC123315634 [Coccinella septempunctata]|uniref:uncharacterized protein LOC123315634 n=1 Tax=Coccinella septempunctata TaxID=41139 RepID=UPI001D08EF7B|nr:uncharacterized protein LOC123315634 [Coccinella septempunctata]